MHNPRPNARRLLLAIAVLATPISTNAASDAVVSALLEEIRALRERVTRLESERQVASRALTEPRATMVASTSASTPAPPSTPSVPGTAKPSWVENTQLKGDFRYRHEGFDVEDRRDRHRQRFRARAAVIGQVSDTIEVGFGLASGGSDPISTNQTLGDGASSKSVVIDLAYAQWQSPIEGLNVVGGKFKNPLHRAGGNSLLWDGDLNPEGVGVRYARGNLFANLLGSWLDESSSDDDSILLGGQFGVDQAISDAANIKAGVGYYNFLDTRGEPVFFDGDPQGNRVLPDGTYASGFELVEAFVEYSTTVNDSKLTVFGDYVNNLDADDFDTGWAIGAKVKQPSGLQLGWTYQELEADAVLGTFTDSDFIGGGTDGEGHILQVGYPLTDRIGLKGTLFLNDRNVDFGTEESFKRLMLDISFKY